MPPKMIVDSDDEDVPLFTKQLKVDEATPTKQVVPKEKDDDDVPLFTMKVVAAPLPKVVVEATPKKQVVPKEKAPAPTTVPTAARLPPTPKAPRVIGAAGDGIVKMAMFAYMMAEGGTDTTAVVKVEMPNGRVVAAVEPPKVRPPVTPRAEEVSEPTPRPVVKREAEEAVVVAPAPADVAVAPALPPAKKLKQISMAAFCFKK